MVGYKKALEIYAKAYPTIQNQQKYFFISSDVIINILLDFNKYYTTKTF